MTSAQLEKITERLLKLLPPQEHQEFRVHNCYLKILSWVEEQIEKGGSRPVIIGVNGPQGCGKSTLTEAWVQVLPELGLRGVTVSIDDFYLTRKEQVALAALHSGNPLLQQRGYPGTHDVGLGIRKLRELQGIASASVRIPRYDKSKNQGMGDRLPEESWPEIRGPLDVVFLEGWMLGFSPIRESVLLESLTLQADPALWGAFQEINRFLLDYQGWHEELDAFIHLIPEEIDFIADWRVEAEERMKAEGRPGLSREEITSYIQKFVLAYQIYLPQLIESALLPGKTISLVLSKERLPLKLKKV